MLHNSPNAVGIAWDSGNAFWVFDGLHQSITFYDFGADHGPGGEDHSDGVIHRWVEGQVRYVEGVGSHMAFDPAAGRLYIADTGNDRVAVLDVRTGTAADPIEPNYDGADMKTMESAPLVTLVDGASSGMEQPSGLALAGGVIYVTDRALSVVSAFDLDGVRLDWLDLSSQVAPGSLGAVEIDAEGRVYVADLTAHRVLRIAPRAP
jgi:DNA-binding beta-propeller fold protein YncE